MINDIHVHVLFIKYIAHWYSNIIGIDTSNMILSIYSITCYTICHKQIPFPFMITPGIYKLYTIKRSVGSHPSSSLCKQLNIILHTHLLQAGINIIATIIFIGIHNLF